MNRARAIGVNSSSVEVYFIDYGNCEVLQKTEVKDLADQFRMLPAQALHCGILGISGTGHKK